MEFNESEAQQCPDCEQPSLEYAPGYKLYECKNSRCRSIFNQNDLDRARWIPVVKPKPATHEEQVWDYSQSIAPEPSPDVVVNTNKTSTITPLMIIAGSIIIAVVMVLVVYPLLTRSFDSPLDFTVTAGDRQNSLNWSSNALAEGVILVYSTSGYPNSVSDGTQLYSGDGTSFVHKGLEYNTKYYYAIWSQRTVEGASQYSPNQTSAAGIPYWRGTGGEPINEYVEYGDDYLVRGADGQKIILTNNPEAQDVTWSELKQFLGDDDTDKEIYDLDTFVCGDFAEMLHNNAEEAGIRTAYVVMFFVDEEVGHTCNAFYTQDQGLVYIDCTGTEEGDVNADRLVQIAVGEQYSPTPVFPQPRLSWGDMGEVEEHWIIW